LELGRASKEGSKKERGTSQLPQDKSKTLKTNPPPLFIYHNLLVDDKKVGFY